MKEDTHEKFFQMEKDFGLFEIRTKDNLPVWDIIRYMVYYYLVFQNYTIEKPITYFSKVSKILLKAWYALRSILSFLRLIIYKSSNFQFGVSRIKNSEGLYYDPYYNSIKQLVPGNLLFYESVIDKNHYTHENRVFDILPLLKNIFKVFKPLKKSSEEISAFSCDKILAAIDNSFQIKAISKIEIDKMIDDFRVEYRFYSWLLKFKKIERVFVTQNGVQKALFKAAKDNKIPTYEFQHGDIVDSTILYNYRYPEFNVNNNIIFPDNLLLFSNLWAKDKFIPAKCIEVGTDHFNSKRIMGAEENSVTIITSNEQNMELEKMAIDLSKADSNLIIYYKLHPAQFYLRAQQETYFDGYKNIKVVSSEKSISDMLHISNEFIAIYSTAVFEVLQAGKIIYIYKRLNYNSFSTYFNIPQVSLIDHANDIYNLRKKRSNKIHNAKSPDFFKPFDRKAFVDSLS